MAQSSVSGRDAAVEGREWVGREDAGRKHVGREEVGRDAVVMARGPAAVEGRE